jgi:rhodanese-related sulfurtransferase
MAADKLEHTTDSLQTVQKLLQEKKAVLLDVREQDEWEAGHIADAKFLPLSELKAIRSADELKSLDKKTIIYCHCKAGVRALCAAAILKRHGFDCRALKDGYSDLVKSGFQTETSKQ